MCFMAVLICPSSFSTPPASPDLYTLSLHDALPISFCPDGRRCLLACPDGVMTLWDVATGQEIQRWQGEHPLVSLAISPEGDRKSTRLNSSHLGISYAVFCLKKNKQKDDTRHYCNAQ